MPTPKPFSEAEWKSLQFAVLDVFMMVSNVEGEGIDDAEASAFYEFVTEPSHVSNPVLQQVLSTLASDYKNIIGAFGQTYKFDGPYFEQSFKRAGGILDNRLAASQAEQFKEELVFQLGVSVANAAGPLTPETGRVGKSELQALTAIAKWLGSASVKSVPKQDVLAGRWNGQGGSYQFTKQGNQYSVTEYGAVGETGTGTATLVANTVTLKANNPLLGAYTIQFNLDGNTLRGSLNVLGNAVPMVLTRS